MTKQAKLKTSKAALSKGMNREFVWFKETGTDL